MRDGHLLGVDLLGDGAHTSGGGGLAPGVIAPVADGQVVVRERRVRVGELPASLGTICSSEVAMAGGERQSSKQSEPRDHGNPLHPLDQLVLAGPASCRSRPHRRQLVVARALRNSAAPSSQASASCLQ